MDLEACKTIAPTEIGLNEVANNPIAHLQGVNGDSKNKKILRTTKTPPTSPPPRPMASTLLG